MEQSNISWLDNYKRKHPAYGTIEQRDQHGNLLSTVEGIVVGRGDNKRVVDPNEVYELATLYCNLQEIADWLGLPRETVKYNFSDIIEKGYLFTKQKLRRKQIQIACDGNVTMLIFLGKNLLGQSDTPTATEGSTVLPWIESESSETPEGL